MTAAPGTARIRVLAWPARANGANPYNRLLYDQLERDGIEVVEYEPGALRRDDWDVLHVHWPEFLLGGRSLIRAAASSAAFFRDLARARARGRRVVWTMHNLEPHDHHPLGAAVYGSMARCADAVVCLSEAGRRAALDRHPVLGERPVAVVPHGHYRGAYPDHSSRDDARARLGIRPGERVLLFFGAVRAYKGLDRMLAAFGAIEDPDVVLVIAGRAEPAAAATIETAATADPRIRPHLGFVPDDEVQWHLRAADLVVLPYARTLSSGVALLALSFERPVLTPDTDAFRELGRRVGERWVQRFDALSPDALVAALRATSELAGREPDLVALDWEALGPAVAAVYARVLDAVPAAERA